MWISNYWYEKLPVLYAIAALLCIVILGRAAMFSALVLVFASALSAWWRWKDRQP